MMLTLPMADALSAAKGSPGMVPALPQDKSTGRDVDLPSRVKSWSKLESGGRNRADEQAENDERAQEEKIGEWIVLGGSPEQVVRNVREGVIGHGIEFESPFGTRRLVYADWIASGRALKQIEIFVLTKVLPLYANTHTHADVTGRSTTTLREAARAKIAECLNADSKDDAVIFCGSGVTGCINKFQQLIGAADAARAAGRKRSMRPVVFISKHEHHSNILPWNEAGAVVFEVPQSAETGGGVCYKSLEALLKKEARRGRLVIGAFSACSNVTGVCVETDVLAAMMHRYGGLAVFDYAGGAPYLEVDMNPARTIDGASCHKDAVFLSPHKFVGGPGSTGVMVVKRACVSRHIPSVGSIGGGTVAFVGSKDVLYAEGLEGREEGGTPAIIGDIRAGLTLTVKQQIGTEWIHAREAFLAEKAHRVLSSETNLVLLGPPLSCANEFTRIPILSFLVKSPVTGSNRYLPWSFVSTLLNDVYGIQSRSGCMCAGPYVADLLGVNESIYLSYVRGHSTQELERIKPGFTRLSISYFCSDEEADFLLNAVVDIARNAWKLLPFYTWDIDADKWLPTTQLLESAPRVSKGREFQTYYEDVMSWASQIYATARDPTVTAEAYPLVQKRSELMPSGGWDLVIFEFAEDIVRHASGLAPTSGPGLSSSPDKYWATLVASSAKPVSIDTLQPRSIRKTCSRTDSLWSTWRRIFRKPAYKTCVA